MAKLKGQGAELGAADLPRSEWERLIQEWVLNQRDRDILRRRLLDGIKYADLAAEFDLSIQQVKGIVYRRQEQVFKHVR